MQEIWQSPNTISSSAVFKGHHLESLDTGSESPSTPTPLLSTVQLASAAGGGEKLTAISPVIMLPEDAATFVLKTGSLSRSLAASLPRQLSKNKSDYGDSSDTGSVSEEPSEEEQAAASAAVLATSHSQLRWLPHLMHYQSGPRARKVVSNVKSGLNRYGL